MKICHVITRMIVGGAQENTLYTIQGHLDKGHEVTLVTGPSPGPEGQLLERFRPAGMALVIMPELVRELNPVKDWQAYCKLKAFFEQQKFDVVHTHASKAGIVGRAAAWNAHVPVVVHTVHGQAFHPYQSQLKNRLYIWAETFAAKRCHRIFSVCQAMIDQCVAAHVAPAEKYQVVYSGMDLQSFIEAKRNPDLRRNLGISEDALVVGKIARLFELKGHDILVEAAVDIVKACPKVKFLIVGNGILKDKIEARVAELGLTDYFVFTGLVPPAEIPSLVAQMDVLLHLSLREGLPRACVQALAAAKPVVAYPLDGTPEVVHNGETGFLVPPCDIPQVARRTIQLLEHPTLREKMGKKGQELVLKQFDWHRMADSLEQEYVLLMK